jgi:hypothetical protein
MHFLLLTLSLITAILHAGGSEGGVGTTGGSDFQVNLAGWRADLPTDLQAYSVTDVISRPAPGQRWWQGVARECRTRGGRPGVFGMTRTDDRTNAQYIELIFHGQRPDVGPQRVEFTAFAISEGERNRIETPYPYESCVEGGRDLQILWNGRETTAAELGRRLDGLHSRAETSVELEHAEEWALLVEHDLWTVPLARTARLPVVSLVDQALNRVLQDALMRSNEVARLAQQVVDAGGECRETPYLEMRRIQHEWSFGTQVFLEGLRASTGLTVETRPELRQAVQLRVASFEFVDREITRQCEAFALYATRADSIESALRDVSGLEVAYEELREIRTAHPNPRVRASLRQRIEQWNIRYMELLFESLSSRLVGIADTLILRRPQFDTFGPEWIRLLGRAAPGAVDLSSGVVALDPTLFPPATMRLFLLHELVHLNDRCAQGGCSEQEMEVRAWRETFRIIDRIAQVSGEPIPPLFLTLKREVRSRGLEAWVRGIVLSRH